MKGNRMNTEQATRAIISAFSAKIVPLSEIVKMRSLNALNAELYAQMDDDGVFDEPWWLDYKE
jgi:hypothetical protein